MPAAHATDWSRVWTGLIAVACAVTLAGAPLPFLHPDDTLFVKAAQLMAEEGDWSAVRHPLYALIPRPPLTIWVMAGSIRLLGETPAALRLWHLLLAMAMAYAVYRLARLHGGREEALLAALLWMTCAQIFYFAIVPQQEIPLTLFLTLALLSYLGYRRDGHARQAASTGLWVGLAVLSKGLMGLAAFGAVAVVDLMVAWRRREVAHLRVRDVAMGAVVLLAVAAPWFVVGIQRFGELFVWRFFLAGDLGPLRALRGFPASPLAYFAGLFAYVPMLAAGVLPWTGVLPAMAREVWTRLGSQTASLRLCAIWAATLFVALSLLPTGGKSERYLVLCYPPLIVLAARALSTLLDAPQAVRRFGLLSLLIGGPLVLAIGAHLIASLPRESGNFLWLIAPWVTALFIAVAAGAWAALRGRGRQAVAITAAGALVAFGAFEWSVSRYWERLWSWRAMAAAAHAHARAGDRLLVIDDHSGASNFAAYYVHGLRVEIAKEDALRQAWPGERVFGLLSRQAFARLKGELHPQVLFRTPTGWVLVTNR